MIDHACSLCALVLQCVLSDAALATQQLASDESTTCSSTWLIRFSFGNFAKVNRVQSGSEAAPEVILIPWQNAGERGTMMKFLHTVLQVVICVTSLSWKSHSRHRKLIPLRQSLSFNAVREMDRWICVWNLYKLRHICHKLLLFCSHH